MIDMKANKAKSKFVYPDKLYARTKDNITLDISYAPQTLEAVEYTRTDAFVDRAEEYIYKQLNEGCIECGDIEKFIGEMKNYIKGE